MQRQSLGGSLSSSGPPPALKKDDICHIVVASQLDIHTLNNDFIHGNGDAEETKKKLKTQKSFKSQIANNAQIVHLIPFLILLCILILFLFSNAPFQKGLGELDELEEMPAATMDLVKIVGDGQVLGLQSMRNLQEAAVYYNKLNFSQHRKFGDFKVAS